MKKRILLGICLVLCLLASACSGSSGSGGGAKDDQAASSQTANPAAAIDVVPTLPPDEALSNVIDPSLYTYEQLNYANGALTLDYPSHWNPIPGTNTICYVEQVSDGTRPRALRSRRRISTAHRTRTRNRANSYPSLKRWLRSTILTRSAPSARAPRSSGTPMRITPPTLP